MAQPSIEPVRQTWASWFLDSFANSVVPASAENEYNSPDETNQESLKVSNEKNMASSASPYGPYVRTGRGGAGNFQWGSQTVKTSTDVEAQNSSSLSERRKVAADIEHLDTEAAQENAQSRKPTSQYVRVGRGGAGNMGFVQSNEPQQSPRSATFPSKSPTTTASPVMYTGRGGAGNFAAVHTAKEDVQLAKEKNERAEAEKRRAEAEQKVEGILQQPSQAWLGGRRRSTGPDDVELAEWK